VPKTAPLHEAPAAGKRTHYARSRDTRERLLAAALAEASEAGFHKTSVARIAARAGVAVGNLHYHFGSRRALLRELMSSLVTDLLARLHVAHPDESDDFFDHERAGLLVYLEYLRANPAYVRLADEVKLHDPELYSSAVKGWVDEFADRIRRGIALGTMRPMDDAEIRVHAYFLLGARHFLDHMLGLDQDAENSERPPYPGDESVVDAYLALVRNGLQTHEPREKTQ
jgi:AcrR family transcriptional regulator